MGAKGTGFVFLNSIIPVTSVFSSSIVYIPIRISSRKDLVVASTSAVALCASLKLSPKSFKCNSDNVGNLNLPPFPPFI